ncbi:MAG: hypothetical protein GYA21_02440 [Myxococcales bacterium]|nr:hypothetical protein [Myxococcales bacterium]
MSQRFRIGVLLATLCAVPAQGAEADLDPLLVEQSDILVPISARGGVHLRADPLAYRLEIDIPWKKASDPTFELIKSLSAAGGRVVKTDRGRGRVRWTVELPYPNLQARLLTEPRSARVRIRLGSGRVLPPETGHYPYSRRRGLPPRVAAALGEAEALLASDPAGARARLLRLAAGEGSLAVLAALALADRMVRAQNLDAAATLLRAVQVRAQRQSPELLPLVRWRIAAYCGNVFQPAGEFLTGERSAYPGWVREETRFAEARLAYARGDMESSVRAGIELFSEAPDSVFGPEVRPMLEAALRRRVAELERDGMLGESAALILDYLHGIPALPLEALRHEAEAAAQGLLGAGLPRLASECVLWLLRTRGAGAITPRLALLLAEAFFAQGDLERTAKTLALHETLPQAKPEAMAVLLRGKLAEARGRPEEAVEYYRQVLVLEPGRGAGLEAARRGAEALRGLGRQVDAVKLVRQGMPPAGDRRAEAADFYVLLGDLAYQVGLKDTAAQAYRELVRRFPKDERTEVAHYRLQRLGVVTEQSPGGGDSPWAMAARLQREKPKPEERAP